ncbi:MmgE/PrpD family protein [Ferrovibrio xuzhouensis]|uniref:MmgE/PrpD family protein n=1 Tax=Ferrovibrio xuzhouensis TaxID=1576914 RepID=A0ABV7VLN5_9PROT
MSAAATTNMQGAVSNAIARHLAEAQAQDLPAQEIAAAKMSLIDVLACALAAKDSPGTAAVLAVCQSERAVGRSTIWMTGEMTTPRQAGFVNSMYAASLDYDSVFHRGVVHSDIIVVPTAVAVGEAVTCSGAELLSTIAYGNDLLCRLSLISPPPRKAWFFSSVYGVIVSAAMTARLLKGNEKQICDAMGLALFSAAGTYQPMTERSTSKQAMAAFAVQAGIHCGYLAVAGLEGVNQPLDGKHGILAMYQNGDLSAVTEGLGKIFFGSQIGRKPYPSCQCNHAPIEGILALKHEYGIKPCDVAEVEVSLSPHACRIVGALYDGQPPSQMTAQFSVQYSIACALIRGKVGIDEIKQPCISDEEIVELARRVRIAEDRDNPNTYVPASVTVRMRDGSCVSNTTTVNRGSASQPMTEAEMLQKVEDCLMSVNRGLEGTAVRTIFYQLMGIDHAPEINEPVLVFLRSVI